jgi:hypothetical protein
MTCARLAWISVLTVATDDDHKGGGVAPAATGKRSDPQLGDAHLDIAGGGRHRLGPVPVAVHVATVSALLAARADRLGGFSLNQRLQPARIRSANTAPASADLRASSWESKAEWSWVIA